MSNQDDIKTPDTAQDANGASAGEADAASDNDGRTSGESVNEESTDESVAQEPDVQAQLEALEAEREELNDRLLRKAAEFQNFRKRMQREKERLYASGKKEVVMPLLEVLDDFQRSLEAADEVEEGQDLEAAYASLKQGVEMIYRKFMDELQNLGVEPIDAEGEPFDETEHEAVMQQPAPEGVEEGVVLQEVRRGYRLDDQVLRHSRVIVSS